MIEAHEKKTLNLREGDWEALQKTYKPKGLTPSSIVRYLVSQHVDALKVNPEAIDDLLEEMIQ